MLRIAALSLVLSSCYLSHELPEAEEAESCGNEAYARGECNACTVDTTYLRRCGDRAYAYGNVRAQFELRACERLTLVSCAIWRWGEGDREGSYECLAPSECSDLDVSRFDELLRPEPGEPGTGRFVPVGDLWLGPPSCEEMRASAPDC